MMEGFEGSAWKPHPLVRWAMHITMVDAVTVMPSRTISLGPSVVIYGNGEKLCQVYEDNCLYIGILSILSLSSHSVTNALNSSTIGECYVLLLAVTIILFKMKMSIIHRRSTLHQL